MSSHKIEEVLDLCDVVSVLRDGKYVGTKSCKGITRQEIVKMMIGREEEAEHMGFLDIGDEVVLEVKHAVAYGKTRRHQFPAEKGRNLRVSMVWWVPAGRELARVITGIDKLDSGEVLVRGQKAHIHSVQDSMEKYRIGYVTENRKEEGLILDFSVGIISRSPSGPRILDKFRKIQTSEEKKIVSFMVDKMKVKTPTAETKVGSLSGGNQQKVSIGKWLAANCDILIIDEPTVGVDVGGKKIHP